MLYIKLKKLFLNFQDSEAAPPPPAPPPAAPQKTENKPKPEAATPATGSQQHNSLQPETQEDKARLRVWKPHLQMTDVKRVNLQARLYPEFQKSTQAQNDDLKSEGREHF